MLLVMWMFCHQGNRLDIEVNLLISRYIILYSGTMSDKLMGLQVFAAVADAGSFASAAARLGISRTKASKVVMDLEAELGTRLLNRTTRQLSLTDAGERYLERVVGILDQLSDADAEAQQQVRDVSGVLRVNVPLSFGVRHVSGRLTEFLRAYPDMRIELSLNDRRVDLVSEGYDLAIRIGTLSDTSLIARKLATSRLVVCASPEYLELAEPIRSPADLTQHSCLAYPMEAGAAIWRFTRRLDGTTHNVRIHHRLWANNGDALAQAAQTSLGVVLQPSFIVHEDLDAGRLVRVLPDYDGAVLDIQAVYPDRAYLPARTRTFLNFLVNAFREDPVWKRCETV